MFNPLILAASIWALSMPIALASSPQASSPAPTEPAQLVEHLLQDNQRYQKTHAHDFFASFQDEQTPSITLLSCSDSRAHSNSFLSNPTNTVFSIRNIGNQVHNNFGSVDYGIYHLHTPILLILGHTHCGAVHAALSNYQSESFAIVREIDHLAIPLRNLLSPLPHQQSLEIIWNQGVEQNVDYQVQTALRRYEKEVKTKRLMILGAVYDFTNAYQQGEGQLVITNVNGMTSPTPIKTYLTGVTPELLEEAVQRLTEVL